MHVGTERLNSCGGWVPNVVASRYGYAPSVAMVHIYILSHGNMHQAIRASHTLVAKEQGRPNAWVYYRETGAFKHIEAMHYRESFGTLGMAMHH